MAATALFTRSERLGGDFYAHIGSEHRLKRRRQKTVTWPLDEKICEVRRFVADDAPSCLGAAVQEYLQCKQGNASSYNKAHYLAGIHVLGAKRIKIEPDNHLVDVPPGFGRCSTAGKTLQPKPWLDAVTTITSPWHCPHKFLLDDSWLWAGGEESVEVASQQQRERRFFEAFYPRTASIPDSPLEPQELSKEIDDTLVIQIPLVALEEERMENEDSSGTENAGAISEPDVPMPSKDILRSVLMKQQQVSTISIADSNIAAAAAAACMMVKALGESDLVDETLLLQILKNPSLLKSLQCSKKSMEGRSQDHVSGTANSRQVNHQELIVHKLPTDYGAHLNSSPVSVLTQWGDGICTNKPVATGGSHMQHSTNPSTSSINMLPPTSYPSCSNPELRRDFLQKGVECIHKQIPEIPKTNLFSRPNLDEASFTHIYGPRNEMRSLSGSIKDSHTSMQSIMPTSTSSVHPTSLPSKDLQQRNTMPLEPSKYRSAEDSLFSRKTTAYSMSTKTGARARRLCLYYNSPKGCRKGESCAFVHQSIDSMAQ